MFPPRLVTVCDDADLSAPKVLGVLRSPLPGPAGVAGCDQPGLLAGLNIALALDHRDLAAGARRLDDPGEAIENTAGVAELPVPATVAVRFALAEVLGRIASDLEQQLARLVRVVVGGD